MNIENYIAGCRESVNQALNKRLPLESDTPCKLHKAMRYTVLNGGKRLRSSFIYAIGDVLGADNEVLHDLSVAVELIHACSLIHDDLPALDNDELRHGKPSCHVAFGEATAILAGDALQSLSYEIIANINKLNPNLVREMISILANATGSMGMAGGEELDIEMVNRTVSVQEVENMYYLKTGCLLGACVTLPAVASNCKDESVILNLKKFGEHIGVSFQIHDDIIGIESDTQILGKKQNSDQILNKPVYPILVGMETAKKRRDDLYHNAIEDLKNAHCWSEALEGLSSYIIKRNF